MSNKDEGFSDFSCPDCGSSTYVEEAVGWWCSNKQCSLSKEFDLKSAPSFNDEVIVEWIKRHDWDGSFNGAKRAMEDACSLFFSNLFDRNFLTHNS